MLPYKQLECVVYTDTDSFFTTDLKPFSHIISAELGDFKDELNGLIISKAIFLGIKQYCYQYFNEGKELVTKTVFAGVKRDTLTYDDFVNLSQGKEIHINNGNRFHRSLSKFTIQIKESNITIKQNVNKTLINNEYLPLNINLTSKNFFNKIYIFNKILNIFNKLIKILK